MMKNTNFQTVFLKEKEKYNSMTHFPFKLNYRNIAISSTIRQSRARFIP